MFSGKFLTIIGAILTAVAVTGSPVEIAERDLQAVRSLCTIPPGFDLQGRVADEMLMLINLHTAFLRKRILLQ